MFRVQFLLLITITVVFAGKWYEAASEDEFNCDKYSSCKDICRSDSVKSCWIKISTTPKGDKVKEVKNCDGRQEEGETTNIKSKMSVNVECSYSNENNCNGNNCRSVSTQTRNSMITINE